MSLRKAAWPRESRDRIVLTGTPPADATSPRQRDEKDSCPLLFR